MPDHVRRDRIDRVPLPLDMAAVDIREVLADGVRAAAKVHLEGTLAEMTEACAAVGLRLELRDGVVARDTASRPGAEAGAEPSTTAVTTDDRAPHGTAQALGTTEEEAAYVVKAIFRGSDLVTEEQFIYRAGRLQSPLKLSLRAYRPADT